VTRRLGLLLGGSLAVWAVAACAAYLLDGGPAVLRSAVALGLCLLPAALTLCWAEWTFRRAPEQYLLTVLGGTGLRLFVVLGGALALQIAVVDLRGQGFLLWVLAFYLITLTFEVVCLLAGRSAAGGQ
jgi:hypothetical protein